MATELSNRRVPPRALILSLAALVVPVVGDLEVPERLADYGALLWLLALVPAFLLAYYRGWKGVATALAVGMATLSTTQVVATWMHRAPPDILLGVVGAYVAVSMGIGWLAETLHRERAIVEDMAFTDLVTHLPNRRHARLFLENEFAAAERGRLLSVVLFDLDHFKAYNDQWGHAGGDEALRAFAGILAPSTRRMDLSARFGGEEFLSVLTSTDTEGALIFADRIREALAARVMSTGAHLTVSAGLATYHPSMRSPDELLAAADQALYEAKHAGRNRVRLFAATMMEHALPSADAAQALLEILGEPEPSDYPRASEDIGRTRPPLTLLPHQVTGFGAGRRALVVEDDGQVRSLLATYLGREGFDVREAGDVPSAIEELRSEFDVVLSDVRLPGASGIELVAAVRSRWPSTAVLVATGLQDARVAAEALNAGADRYVFKPFGMPDLRRHLVDVLESRDRNVAARAARRSAGEGEREGETRARESILRALRSLVDAVELRSPLARGHGRRVASYAEPIAKVLDPGEDVIPHAALRLGCEMHDLGKVGVPPSVLAHESDPDADELEQLRAHPSVGRRILEPLLDDEHVLAAVAWHHERWDGTGYPDGLAGESIPIEARVVALCDALDLLTREGGRPSRRRWDDAVIEIRSGSGTRFDPRVVAAMDTSLDSLRALFDGTATGSPGGSS